MQLRLHHTGSMYMCSADSSDHALKIFKFRSKSITLVF